MPEPIYVRTYEAKARFGVSRSTIYQWAKAGHITIHKRGGMSLLRVAEVVAFIEGRDVEESDL